MTRDPSQWRMASVRLMPLSESPFSLQLALAERSDGSSGPFYRLPEEDVFTNSFLGVFKGDADSTIDFCSVKVLRSDYRADETEGSNPPTNVAIEREFRDEVERIRDLRSSASIAPRLIHPDPATGGSNLPPLFYCRSGQRLFSPPCPRCGGALATCRDDALLARRDLPRFASSLQRFLFCDVCHREDPEAPLYSYTEESSKNQALVGSVADLFRDIGEFLAGENEGASRFPCPDCVEAARKFQTALASGLRGAPFWENRWEIFTFYDSPLLITGIGALSLDELADAIGGRSSESFLESGLELPALISSARFRYPAAEKVDSGSGRLFGAESWGLDAVEVLYLKVAAAAQAVEAALTFARAFGRPHLDLHPRHFQFDFSQAGEELPWLWGFQVRLHGLSSSARADHLGPGVEVLIPPRKPSVPYAAPEILEFHVTAPRPAQLILSELEEAGVRGDASGVRLHGRLSDPYGISPPPSERDWILLLVDNEALGLSHLVVPCRRDPRLPVDSKDLTFISEPIVLEPSIVRRLRETSGARIPGARYRVFTAFGAPSDLYSLGLILLRVLVGNDAQDARTIALAVERAVRLVGTTGEAAHDLLAKDASLTAVLAKANVLYQSIDRAPNRPNAIPDPLWRRVIELGLRLVTRIEGFSICATAFDFDVAHPTAKLETTLQTLHSIRAELKALLFERQPMHLEIQQVLSDAFSETPQEHTAGRMSGPES